MCCALTYVTSHMFAGKIRDDLVGVRNSWLVLAVLTQAIDYTTVRLCCAYTNHVLSGLEVSTSGARRSAIGAWEIDNGKACIYCSTFSGYCIVGIGRKH